VLLNLIPANRGDIQARRHSFFETRQCRSSCLQPRIVAELRPRWYQKCPWGTRTFLGPRS